ncbi:DUF1464 domain-containing protein [Candidatus Bathyarchaeota archaeon]|nr:MAG: DUF1464 domain-containing protein [Candidatus Bathyarchaeota archaeon]
MVNVIRVAVVDPGTKSFDVCGLENGKLILAQQIPTKKILKNPDLLIKTLKNYNFDLIVGPSGYGLPLTQLNKTRYEIFKLSLIKPSDKKLKPQIGLRNVLLKLKNSGLNVYMISSVKHLPTVPTHRKINKVDMGTADKVCCAALAIQNQAKHYNLTYQETSFILVELGFGYNAFLAVEKGKIVDGIGGTLSHIGFLSQGFFDGELAYLLGRITKPMLLTGGAALIAGMKKPNPEKFMEKIDKNKRFSLAWEAYLEGIEKDVLSLKASIKNPKEILVSGRFVKIEKAYKEILNRLSSYGRVRKLEGFTFKVKEAAQGAALIADGLAEGKYKNLIECMEIKKAKGSFLDYIYQANIKKLSKMFYEDMV